MIRLYIMGCGVVFVAVVLGFVAYLLFLIPISVVSAMF